MATSVPDPVVHLTCVARGEFIELRTQNGSLRVRCGRIGHPCLVVHATYRSQDKAHAQQQRLVEGWTAQGFVDGPPTSPVIEGSVVQELFCDGREAHPLLAPFFQINGAQDLRGQARRLALFKQGLRWQGDFDLERIAEMGLHAGVIVEGDVQVSGMFTQLTPTHPGCVLIAGDLRAASVGHGDSHMRVLGDVCVDGIVYGEGNDGSLHIGGSVHGRAFITCDHDMHAEGGYHLPVSDWNTDENWSDCLHPDLLDEEGLVRPAVMRRFMREGLDPFRAGARLALRTDAGAPPPDSPTTAAPATLDQALAPHALADDVEAITRLLEDWPVRDEEWSVAVAWRVCMPSTTEAQRQRLLALGVRLRGVVIDSAASARRQLSKY